MAQGVYGKDVHFEDGFKPQWDQLVSVYPELFSNGSTGRYLRWETADPERWVPDEFVIIQIDFTWKRKIARVSRSALAARNRRLL